jgi:hypothetical protein
MIDRLKSFLSKVDRYFGYRVWSFFWSKVGDENYIYSEQISDEELLRFFPDLASQDLKSQKYHQSLGASYIIKLSEGFIEGSTGWVYSKGLPSRFSYPYAAYPWRQIFFPHFLFHLLKIATKKATTYHQAVNLVWHGWSNYYHFLIDILPILDLLNSHFDKVQVLVPVDIKYSKFVQDYFHMYPERYRSLDFVYVQPNEIVKVKDLLLVNKSRFASLPTYKKGLSGLVRKLFLVRPMHGQRSLNNLHELRTVLDEFDFQIIDTASMNLQEQIAIFQDVSILVGIHGAGMTNLVFSKNLKYVLEIFPAGVFKPLHYKHLTIMKGSIDYRQLTGSEIIEGTDSHFYLDPNRLRNALEYYEIKKLN